MTHSFTLCVGIEAWQDVGKGKIDHVDATIEGSTPKLAMNNVVVYFPASIVKRRVWIVGQGPP